MKVLTLFGTRPEIIRLSRVIPLLDAHATHTLVHTGQNYDPRLSDLFFEELGVRAADEHLGVRASGFAGQAAQILERSAAALARVRPDRLLILGDTNSGLAAVVAARMGIPVYHMPSRLILLGHGENSIFEIHGQLLTLFPMLEVVPVIADIRNTERLDEAFRAHDRGRGSRDRGAAQRRTGRTGRVGDGAPRLRRLVGDR